MTDDDWDKILNDALGLWEASKRRRENPYALHLIKVLWPYGARGLRRVDAIHRIWLLREPTGLNMPKKFEHTVQSAFNSHNSLVKDGPDALFYPAGGKRSGQWAVHIDRIGPWLRRKGLAPI